jgi:predicted CXXCH cytochrome family protein
MPQDPAQASFRTAGLHVGVRVGVRVTRTCGRYEVAQRVHRSRYRPIAPVGVNEPDPRAVDTVIAPERTHIGARNMHMRLAPLLVVAAIALVGLARAEASRLAPLPAGEAISTHGPYQMGACETCHQRHDAKNPGAAMKISNDLCYDCHDEFRGHGPVKMEKAVHPKNTAACTMCHNPHNSRKKKLRL